jgi:glycosyltransferase involved in cell wall biosynthesis
LLIVGDGPGKGKLLADLHTAGVNDYAYLVGAVPPERVPGLLASMDVAVAPAPKLASFYFSPLKVYEYMAAGRAVVAGRIGQMAELIQDGVTGLLVAPGDPAELASALERLVRDPGLRQRLGQRARHSVEREHTWDAVWERILQSVLTSTHQVETN